MRPYRSIPSVPHGEGDFVIPSESRMARITVILQMTTVFGCGHAATFPPLVCPWVITASRRDCASASTITTDFKGIANIVVDRDNPAVFELRNHGQGFGLGHIGDFVQLAKGCFVPLRAVADQYFGHAFHIIGGRILFWGWPPPPGKKGATDAIFGIPASGS